MISRNKRKFKQQIFIVLCALMTLVALGCLLALLVHIFVEGWSWLNWSFIENFPSRFPSKAGLKSALYGTIWVVSLTALLAVPIGVSAALYLKEYAPKSKWIRLIEINIANLAGMPSIIYGLLGLSIFVRYFGLDRSIWSGAMTLALLILPIIIIASKGAIASVPQSLSDGAYALGARKWQVVLYQVLPAALPGIMTSIILAISRAIGETAPLIMIGALSYVAFVPENANDAFTVLPVQIYNWAARPQEDFHAIAAAGIIVLLGVLLTMNLIAVIIRQKFQRYQ